jgi:hypothetical protein
MSSSSRLTRGLRVACTPWWAKQKTALSHNPPSAAAATLNASSHGFITATFTRALRSSVRQRLHRTNPEWCDDGQHDNLDHLLDHGSDCVDELCLNVQPFDVVVYSPAISAITKIFLAANLSQTKSRGAKSLRTADATSKPNECFSLTSTALPLVHCDLSHVRIFVPALSVKTGGSSSVRCDVILVQIQAIRLHTQPDNPLQRIEVDSDIYQRALSLGLTRRIGCALEDRQFQLDLNGCSVYCGTW